MKLGKNDPCHCGSGQKYKKCHLDADDAARIATMNAAAAASAAKNAAPEEGDESTAAKHVDDRNRTGSPAKPKPTGKIQQPPVRRRAV